MLDESTRPGGSRARQGGEADSSSSASNPWVALRSGDDAARVAADMSSARMSFLAGAGPGRGESDGAVRSVVHQSWMRSLHGGVSSEHVESDVVLGARELDEYRRHHPMAAVVPVVRRLLVDGAEDTGIVVAVSDERGRLLWLFGDRGSRDRAAEMNFVEGSDWSEDRVGTNAPGTSLRVDHPVQIYASEHFNAQAHEWGCSAAPVHDPDTGAILGAIDVTGGARVAVAEALHLVRATVAAAESELRLTRLARSDPPPDTARLSVLGGARTLTTADGASVPLSGRHAEILVLLTENPDGLGSARLAMELDHLELGDVTVRAEISRLRRVLGKHAIDARPYRLNVEVASDLACVRAALDRGDAAAALRAYTGPLLPESIAPGIEAIREEVHARLLAELVRTGDPALLRRWTQARHGRNDLSAWRAYLLALEPHSSAFVQAKAQMELVDRQLRG